MEPTSKNEKNNLTGADLDKLLGFDPVNINGLFNWFVEHHPMRNPVDTILSLPQLRSLRTLVAKNIKKCLNDDRTLFSFLEQGDPAVAIIIQTLPTIESPHLKLLLDTAFRVKRVLNCKVQFIITNEVTSSYIPTQHDLIKAPFLHTYPLQANKIQELLDDIEFTNLEPSPSIQGFCNDLTSVLTKNTLCIFQGGPYYAALGHIILSGLTPTIFTATAATDSAVANSNYFVVNGNAHTGNTRLSKVTKIKRTLNFIDQDIMRAVEKSDTTSDRPQTFTIATVLRKANRRLSVDFVEYMKNVLMKNSDFQWKIIGYEENKGGPDDALKHSQISVKPEDKMLHPNYPEFDAVVIPPNVTGGATAALLATFLGKHVIAPKNNDFFCYHEMSVFNHYEKYQELEQKLHLAHKAAKTPLSQTDLNNVREERNREADASLRFLLTKTIADFCGHSHFLSNFEGEHFRPRRRYSRLSRQDQLPALICEEHQLNRIVKLSGLQIDLNTISITKNIDSYQNTDDVLLLIDKHLSRTHWNTLLNTMPFKYIYSPSNTVKPIHSANGVFSNPLCELFSGREYSNLFMRFFLTKNMGIEIEASLQTKQTLDFYSLSDSKNLHDKKISCLAIRI